jgi:hypothetical protein
MSLLHTMLFVLWVPSAGVMAFALCAWLGSGMETLRTAGLQRLGRPRREPQPALWPMAVASLAAMAALLGAAMTFPNEAHLRHTLERIWGYDSTRIVLALRHDDAATRLAVLDALRPLMEQTGRPIRVYKKSRNYHNYVLSTDVPSYYRFTDGRLEIAAGGIVGDDRLAFLQHGFAALARFATRDSIPQHLSATVRIGGTTFAVDLLPRTARLFDDNSPLSEPLLPQAASTGRCALEVQALLTAPVFPWPRATGRMSGEVELQSASAQGGRRYALAGLRVSAGQHRPWIPQQAEEHERIPAVLRLLPPDLRAVGMGCDSALPFLADPALAAASMLSIFPALEGRITGVSVQHALRFSPWHEQGWTAVAPHQTGQ